HVGRESIALFVMDRHLIGGHGAADGGEAAVEHPVLVGVGGEVYGEKTGVAGGLGEAITMHDTDAVSLMEAMGQFGRERSGSADDVAEAGEVVLREVHLALVQ